MNFHFQVSIDKSLLTSSSKDLTRLFPDHLENPSVEEILAVNATITSIEIRRCLKYFTCNSIPEPTAKKSILEYKTPLNLYSSSWFDYHIYLIYERTDDLENVLTDIQILPNGKDPITPANQPGKWISNKFNSNINIWLYYSPNTHQTRMIRDIDVLFGHNDLSDDRPYWKYQPNPILLPFTLSIPPHLSLLKFSQDDLKDVDSKFNDLKSKNIILSNHENYKIMQISDLHFGQNLGLCLDGDNSNCKSDYKTVKFMELAIKADKPDLVVITGDLIDFRRLKNFKSVILKALSPILKNRIPFVFTFGESDYNIDNDITKKRFLKFISSLPLCYNKPEPEDNSLHGLSNYNLNVYYVENNDIDINNLALNKPNAHIAILDSENKKIDSSQINYLYRLNGDFDATSKIFKLLFFHYPLPNFRPQGKFKLIGGYNMKSNLNSASNPKFKNDIINMGYHVVSVGHEHENDACLLSYLDNDDSKLIWLCYNSITGDSGQTDLNNDYQRKLRMFSMDLADNSENKRLLSWKVGESDAGAIDYQKIFSF